MVTNNVPDTNGLSQASATDFVINVAMPADIACSGAFTGNVCTIRCHNGAQAGPFGGCFASQQTDTANNFDAAAAAAGASTTASAAMAVATTAAAKK
ncbi:hypothetical protein BJ878DRAFT_537892 [Calycina marina]|uniref:Uncharacterized protein n=1 Tax=Calycina marina TaxID=1763456 RepID=A0A9P8CIZ6_9HELO|nr:hypothetical protein BJ878DRAFT_537892 [Calycina marina]